MGKREKIVSVALLLVAFSSLLISAKNYYYSHTKPVASNGGIYTEGFLGQPTYINPLLAHQETDLALVTLIYNGLYKYNSSGEIVADLADGLPVVSADQKQYTINLKRGVKWHNDKTFTADDVVFTIQTLKDPAYKSPLRSLWLSTDVEKIGDYTVKFTTKDVSGPFLGNLTIPIIPQVVWSKVDAQNFLLAKQNLEAVGTGPYSVKEIKKLPSGKIQSLTLQAFPEYFGGRPHINNIVVSFYDAEEDLLNALHSREILGFGYTSLGSNLYLDKNQADLQILSLPLPQYQVAFLNLNNKFLSDKTVRQALALAVDRQQIITEALKGNAVMPSLPFTSQPQQLQQNLDQAKKLLDAAGWTVDGKTNFRSKKNVPLELTITTNDSLPNAQAAQLLANQWRALNLKINLTVLPTKQLTDNSIKPRNFDVLLFPLKFGADPDPFSFWHSSQAKDPGLNLSGFTNQAADSLITMARTTTNQAVRQQKYQEFGQLLADQVPAIFLDQTLYIYAIDSKVQNVGLNKIYESYQRFSDLPNWYMDTKRVWK